MKKKLLTLAALVVFSLAGCCEKPYDLRLRIVRENTRFEKRCIDQVFKDNDGYIVVYQDKDGTIHNERYETDGADGDMKGSPLEYYTRMVEYHGKFKELNQNTKQAVVICRDLKSDEQSYIVMLKSRVTYCGTVDSVTDCNQVNEKKDMYFVEIHLPYQSGITGIREGSITDTE